MNALGLRVIVLVASLVFGIATPPPASAENAGQPQIRWQPGPTTANLGKFAEIDVPRGFLFADKANTMKLLELTHNIPSGAEVGAVVPAGDDSTSTWFVTFEFDDAGYVKDDEKDKINPDALLKSIREGTEAANQERRKRGWPTVTVLGWERLPYYDSFTHNLTWAIRGAGGEGDTSVNHSVRILGRRGTMRVDFVQGVNRYALSVPAFESVITGFRFKQGSRYADFTKGDKMAGYGLTALIAGTAGAVAVKTGLLGSFGKVLLGLVLLLKKALVVIVLAVGAFFKRLWNKFTGRSEEPPPGQDQGPPPAIS